MSRKVIELVQVLVDRIEKNGYQQRAREENAFDLNKRLTEAEGWVAHWKQARQEAHEAGELMRAEIETLRTEVETLQKRRAAVQVILDRIWLLSEVNIGDAEACIDAVCQIRKYFNPSEYPVLKGGE